MAAGCHEDEAGRARSRFAYSRHMDPIMPDGRAGYPAAPRAPPATAVAGRRTGALRPPRRGCLPQCSACCVGSRRQAPRLARSSVARWRGDRRTWRRRPRALRDPRLAGFLGALGEARPALSLYMSTTGVYGDTGRGVVTEASPVMPGDRSRPPAVRGGARRRRGASPRGPMRHSARAGDLRPPAPAAGSPATRRAGAPARRMRARATASTSTTS